MDTTISLVKALLKDVPPQEDHRGRLPKTVLRDLQHVQLDQGNSPDLGDHQIIYLTGFLLVSLK